MGTEEEKGITEVEIFREFVETAELPIEPSTIIKQTQQGKPDIRCTHREDGDMEFELVEICSPEIAKQNSKIRRGEITESEYLRLKDPSQMILTKKLSREYDTDLPVDLLCYTAGRTVSTDTQILETAKLLLNSYKGVFRKAWLLGEKGATLIWNAS